jgi:hypothetical protein
MSLASSTTITKADPIVQIQFLNATLIYAVAEAASAHIKADAAASFERTLGFLTPGVRRKGFDYGSEDGTHTLVLSSRGTRAHASTKNLLDQVHGCSWSVIEPAAILWFGPLTVAQIHKVHLLVNHSIQSASHSAL